MAYILVQNRGSIGIQGIRLLGCSNKREEQIGRFGTGLKEAIALFTRLGIKMVMFSDDRRIDFEIQTVDGQQEICFKLDKDWNRWQADQWHGLGIHPGFGKHDWNDIWQALREVVCNAWDEGADDFYTGIFGDDMPLEGKEGSTRVFIEADAEVMEIYFTLPRKLLFMSKRSPTLCTCDFGAVLDKQEKEEGPVQIFHKRVWVQSGEKSRPSLYNYECSQLSLNESRNADWYKVHEECGRVLASANFGVISKILEATQEDGWSKCFEWQIISTWEFKHYAEKNAATWRSAWIGAFGTDACACKPDSHIMERVKRSGYKAIPIDGAFISTLSHCGIRTHESILTKEEVEGMEITDMQIESVHTMWMTLNRRGLIPAGKVKPKTFAFTKPSKEGVINTGFLKNGDMYVNLEILGSQMEETEVLNLLCQHVSGNRPQTYDYENWLVKALRTVTA